MDEFQFQYQFIQGVLSRKEILEQKKDDEEMISKTELILDQEREAEETGDETDVVDLEVTEDGEVVMEEEVKNVEAKGHFKFLNLDEIDAYRDQNFGSEQTRMFEEGKGSKLRTDFNNAIKENTVAGLVTEFTVRDGRNSGEKIAFLTLEDYTGSYSFRLGDRDYMKLKDKIDIQRFLIFKVKFSVARDNRVFLNVVDVYELKEAFERFASTMTVVMDIRDIRPDDIGFIRSVIQDHSGEQKLHFFLKNAEDNSHVELNSMRTQVSINGELMHLFAENNKYQIFLN